MTKSVQYHYGKFPPAELEWKQLIPLIGPASAALARYDGTLNAVPNPNVLLSPLATQEAVLSSKKEERYFEDHRLTTNHLVDHISNKVIYKYPCV